MKNVGHIAGEERARVRDRVDRLLPRRLRDRVRRRRQRPRRRLGLRPVGRRAARGRAGAVLVVRLDPGAAALPVRGRLRGRVARDRLGRDGGAGEALGLLRLRRRLHAPLLGRLALDLEPRRLAVLEGHAGLRRLDRRPLPGRARRARRRAAPRAADRQVRRTASRARSPATTWPTRRSACSSSGSAGSGSTRLDARASTSAASASSPTWR